MNTPDSRIYVGRLDGGRSVVYAVDAAGAAELGLIDWEVDALALARALLLDASGSEPPADLCRLFAAEVIIRLPRDGFVLQRETVTAWLRRTVAV